MASLIKQIAEKAKRLKLIKRYICATLCKIHLVDKCLLIIMISLLLQSAHILLTNGGKSSEANHIDIIVRTASASIFGYFLSANFMQRSTAPKGKGILNGKLTQTSIKSSQLTDVPQNRIGFAAAQTDIEPENINANEDLPPSDNEPVNGRLQIITATVIAMFCLAVLLIVRDIAGHDATSNASTAAVVTQFRDFVSACVGFLIGCPTSKAEK